MSRWKLNKAIKRLERLDWLCDVGPNKKHVREVFAIAAFLRGEIDRLQQERGENWQSKVTK